MSRWRRGGRAGMGSIRLERARDRTDRVSPACARSDFRAGLYPLAAFGLLALLELGAWIVPLLGPALMAVQFGVGRRLGGERTLLQLVLQLIPPQLVGGGVGVGHRRSVDQAS